MNLSITDTSEYILQLLARHRHGTVHSVYRKTINLSFDGRLAALQAKDSPLSPISMILPLTEEEIAALSINEGTPVLVNPDFLQIGEEHCFCFRHASMQDLELKKALTTEQLIRLEEKLLGLLSHHYAGSFELLFSDPSKAKEIPFLAVAEKHLNDASQALAASCWDDAARRLCRMIGLGLGLTPGGDDFLCGVLAALILSNHSRHPFTCALETHIAAHLTDTNEISAAFLCCALDKQFSQAVNSLSLLPSGEQILASFSAIGHSSGTDTLCGITYLLKNRSLL